MYVVSGQFRSAFHFFGHRWPSYQLLSTCFVSMTLNFELLPRPSNIKFNQHDKYPGRGHLVCESWSGHRHTCICSGSPLQTAKIDVITALFVKFQSCLKMWRLSLAAKLLPHTAHSDWINRNGCDMTGLRSFNDSMSKRVLDLLEMG